MGKSKLKQEKSAGTGPADWISVHFCLYSRNERLGVFQAHKFIVLAVKAELHIAVQRERAGLQPGYPQQHKLVDSGA